MSRSTLTFFGGAGSVTGSNFMVRTQDVVFLVDCGMYQGSQKEEEKNYEEFSYDPSEVDVLFVTHAHADHIGRIPKLVRDGFRGEIYSIDVTKDLAEVMFEDALSIAYHEKKETGKEHYFDENDVEQALSQWKTINYHEPLQVKGLKVTAKDAGHILGSAIYEITRGDRTIAFTGDLGNAPTPLLRKPEPVTDAHYMVMESVYGDRNHEGKEGRTQVFSRIITETIERDGALVMPAFSIERTQVMLYELNELVESGDIPSVPVYLDSPLAIRVTEIYKQYTKYFNKDARGDIKEGDDIFDFPNFHFSPTREDSKEINSEPNPKIIIAGSGMSEGGRILHHERRYLEDPASTILIVGYQPPGGLGRALLDGTKTVTLFGEKISVHAHIESIMSYSAHMGSDDLIEYGSTAGESGALEKVFVAMGEPRSSSFLAQRLRDYHDIKAIVPEEGHTATIEF